MVSVSSNPSHKAGVRCDPHGKELRNMKVLITKPDHESQGGVANYYKKLQAKFEIPAEYFIVGRRGNEKYLLSKITRLVSDYWNYFRCLNGNNIDLVHINPSLDLKSFMRDGIFVLLAGAKKKKILVFFRGWQKSFETRVEHNFIWLFKFLFGKSDAFIVLSDYFKKKLEEWGIRQAIYKEVTVIDNNELKGFDIKSVVTKRLGSKKWRILFLSRIIKNKGIYETIEAISLLSKKYPNVELIVAGDGEELENVKSLIHNRKINNVIFSGYVKGEEKRRIYEDSHVFCFPTYHGEGLPVSIVEAMAYGLPVVTRPVGGIADFFKDGVNGFITESKDANIFADLLERLLLDKKLYEKISLSNYHYAQSHFLASDAAIRLERIYRRALKKCGRGS